MTAQLLDQKQYANMTKPQYVNFDKNLETRPTVISLNCVARAYLSFTNTPGLLSGLVIVSKLTPNIPKNLDKKFLNPHDRTG